MATTTNHQNGSSSSGTLPGSDAPRAPAQATVTAGEASKAASGSRTAQPHKPAQARPTSSTGSGSDGKRVSTSDIQFVQNLIERCLQLYMTQAEIVQTLQAQAKIEPGFTNLVWQKLEEQNPDFFRAYYTRLKVKDQIILFNHLVEQQAQVLQKLQRSLMQQLPPTLFPRTGMHMPSMHMPGIPMNRPQPMPAMAMPGHMLMNHNMQLPFPPQGMMMQGNQHMQNFMPAMQQLPQQPQQQQQQVQQQQPQNQQDEQSVQQTQQQQQQQQQQDEHDNPLDMLAAQDCQTSEDMGLLPMGLRGSAADLMSGVLGFGNGCPTGTSNELPDLPDNVAAELQGFSKSFSFSNLNVFDYPGQMMGDGMGDAGMGLQANDLPRSFSLSDLDSLER